MCICCSRNLAPVAPSKGSRSNWRSVHGVTFWEVTIMALGLRDLRGQYREMLFHSSTLSKTISQLRSTQVSEQSSLWVVYLTLGLEPVQHDFHLWVANLCVVEETKPPATMAKSPQSFRFFFRVCRYPEDDVKPELVVASVGKLRSSLRLPYSTNAMNCNGQRSRFFVLLQPCGKRLHFFVSPGEVVVPVNHDVLERKLDFQVCL